MINSSLKDFWAADWWEVGVLFRRTWVKKLWFQWELKQAVTLSSSFIFSVQDSSRGGFVWILGYKALRGSQGQKVLEFVRHPAFLFEQKLSREHDVTELTKSTVSKAANFFLRTLGKEDYAWFFREPWSAAFTLVWIFSWGSVSLEMGVTTVLWFPDTQVFIPYLLWVHWHALCWLQISVHPQLCVSFVPVSSLCISLCCTTSGCLQQ